MIGQQIWKLRQEQKISQRELAAKLFVTPQAVSKWEKDISTPNPEAVLQMANFFGVTTDYLLGNNPHAETTATPEGDGRREKFARLFEGLTQDQQDLVIAAMKGFQGEK